MTMTSYLLVQVRQPTATLQTPSSRRAGSSSASLMRHQELHGLAAVDDAVVVGQRHVHHRTHDDLAVHGHRALLDLVHAEDAALGRVEDRAWTAASRTRRRW